MCLCMYLCTVEFFQSDGHRTRELPDYQIMGIIRHYLYWPMFLQVIFYYCSNVWVTEVIRGVLHWISPSDTGSGASELPCCFLWVSSLSTTNADGPGDSETGVFIAEEIEGVGDRGSGDAKVFRQSWRPFWRSSRVGTVSHNCWSIKIPEV